MLLLALLAWGCDRRDHGGESASLPAASPPRPSQPSRYVRPEGQKRVFVFIHGILGDSDSTWKNRNGAYFPELLAADPQLPASDVYVYEYPTRFLSQGPFSIPEIAANMRNRLLRARIFDSHEEVIFVAHSMGGLVVEQFLLTYRPLAAKTPFVALYSTPQTGAAITRLGTVFSWSRQLAAMLPGEDNLYLEGLEAQWKNRDFRTVLHCAYEKKATKGILIVGRESATRLCEGDTVPIDADHIGVAKPEDRDADAYVALFNWITEHDRSAKSLEGYTNLATPRPMTLENLVGLLEKKEGVTIVFRQTCGPAVISAEVPRGSYSGANLKELLESLQLRIKTPGVRYKVDVVKEDVRYEIRCE